MSLLDSKNIKLIENVNAKKVLGCIPKRTFASIDLSLTMCLITAFFLNHYIERIYVMTDMQRAQILHELGRLFDVSDSLTDALLVQIKDQNIKANYSRIARGLTVENNYRHFSSAMPWVKNINGLDQQQEAAHKVKYQAPDYSLLVENSQLEVFNVLIDVKSVNGGKETCEITPKQKHALMNYARDHRAPILLAIYWQRLGYWTHNVITHLGGKKHNKINWSDAIKNDLSHILGDYTFLINKPFYRRTTFSPNKMESGAGNEKHGYFDSIQVGNNLDRMKEYNVIYSSLIDSIFNARIIDKIKHEDSVTVTEVFAENPMLIKTSNVLVNYLNIWNVEPSEGISETKIIDIGRKCFVDLMQDLAHEPIYTIPTEKNAETDRVFKLAYDNTTVLRQYQEK